MKFKKVLGYLIIILAAFAIFIHFRPSEFHYTVTEQVNAPALKVFPYLSHLELGSQWSPFEVADPQIIRTYMGDAGQKGALMIFKGNSQVGSGRIEVLDVLPHHIVDLKLTMETPVKAENFIRYALKEADDGNSVWLTWSMKGKNGFLGKLFGLVFNMEKMMTAKMKKGIENLNDLINDDQSKEATQR